MSASHGTAGIRSCRASAPLRVHRNFVAQDPDLAAALAHAEPWLPAAIDALTQAVPIPPTVKPFAEPPFYRPTGSHRCHYYGPSTLADASGRAVVALKGMEPCAADFDALLRDLGRPCYSPHNIAEHLVFEEARIPACVGLREAVHEGERAATIQSAHLRSYGELARLPLPLLVLRHSDEVCARTGEALRRALSAAAFEALAPRLAQGLAVYVYYYPTAPIRARDLDYLLRGMCFRDRMWALLKDLCDPDELIERWVRGFVRMLYLGFLPGSLASLRTGICCQSQNACIDGGFTDLGSLTPFTELRDDTAVFAALQLSTEALLHTVRTLVAGSSDPTRPESLEVRIDLHHLGQHLHARIREAIAREARPGLALDPRVSQYFTPPGTFAELVDRLGTYYGPPSELDAANADFRRLGLSLIQAARGA